MKDNSAGKENSSEPNPELAKLLAEIPAELKMFVTNTPAELLGKYFTQEQAEKMAGMMSGMGYEVGIDVPEFARNASKEFWKYFYRSGFNPVASQRDFGTLTKSLDAAGQVPSRRKKTDFEISMLRVLPVLFPLWEKELAALPDEEKAEYYAGRVEGKKVINKFNADYIRMVKRARIYLFISMLWRLFEEFKSMAEAGRFLRECKIINDKVSSDEVRAVFRQIGLRYRGPGRPKRT